MKPTTPFRIAHLGACVCALIGAGGSARAADAPDPSAARLDTLARQVNEQSARLDALKRAVTQEEASLNEVKRVLGQEVLASQRARGIAPDAAVQTAQADAAISNPVGQAPDSAGRATSVAQIFEQPGVLTPKGKGVLEPSLQYSYSSSNRVALVGYTVIPAILIGVVDVREVKRNTFNATLTGRYGITNRFELEARVPYVHRSDTTVGREFLEGAAANSTFDASGTGIGDVEVTGRYQFNDGGLDKPYFVGSLRFKSRTGKDPFEVESSRAVAVGLRNEAFQNTLPTGSGFYGIQPALTALFPSDPVVFFGTISYLHSIKRSGVVRQTDTGPELLGAIQPGGVFGFNFGMGLGLNDKSSFSIGYDHASVGRTKLNGVSAADSVRVQLGTLLLGYSYRLSSQRSLSVSLGAGVTRDAPDVTLTVRMPVTF